MSTPPFLASGSKEWIEIRPKGERKGRFELQYKHRIYGWVTAGNFGIRWSDVYPAFIHECKTHPHPEHWRIVQSDRAPVIRQGRKR